MSSEILIADGLHIHKKNFSSLFEFLASANITYHVFCDHDELRNCTLISYLSSEKLKRYASIVEGEKKEVIFGYKYRGVSVFDVIRAELLSGLISDGMYTFSFDREIDFFEYCFENARKELVVCYCAAMYWLDVWHNELTKNNYKYVIIFSGSSISAKSMLRLCRYNSTEPLLVESFFTGKHFYLENKYDPIANNSDLRFCFPSFNSEIDLARWSNSCEYLNGVGSNNKNVKQPTKKQDIPIKNYLLLTCQVINDYSLIDSFRDLTSSIELYKEIIGLVIGHTDYNLVVKVHPWERKKVKSAEPVTYLALAEYLNSFQAHEASRVLLTEESNLHHLISDSVTTITLCSQSGLEASFLGKKPIIIGGSFYSGKGFSHDIESPKLLPALLNSDFRSFLSLSEFNQFMAFMNYCLCEHLVCSELDSFDRLPQIFNDGRGCVSNSAGFSTGKRFWYEAESGFLKRNLFKLVENPSQVFRDLQVIYRRLAKKVAYIR
ncbi:hypothetical protein [Microbulbifer aggregans]|uniref:capsular polysaccharide export protein, LipB/KpsS family n=1 Tax=Microbulbifer aggregans TaxID=1769779 RepID=UPI001CFEC1D4|nr:hypothetical protein [Microbulbifer aggregans]